MIHFEPNFFFSIYGFLTHLSTNCRSETSVEHDTMRHLGDSPNKISVNKQMRLRFQLRSLQ